MNDVQSLFSILDERALFATAPMLTLALAVALLLLADVIDALKGVRTAILLGFLALAGWREYLILENPVGPVLGETFVADAATAQWGLLFIAATALSWVFSVGYYRHEDGRFKGEHDVLMLAAPIGMMLMVGANELLVFFVGLELLSIPLYVLCAFRRSQSHSVEAGLKYFLLGSFASGLFLYGAALLYAGTGEVALSALRETGVDGLLGLGGVALLAASVFFKISVFPFHLWVPDVYEGSPTPVTALMATGTKAAAFGFLINATFLLPVESATWIALVALVTMAAGNLGALVQGDLKRMLAYSGVAHAGTLLLASAAALGGGDLEGARTAILVYMAAYVFTAVGAFGLVALLEADGQSFTKLENLRGLAKTRPRTAAACALFMLSLGGIPLTGGFMGKWMIFALLVRADMIAVAVLAALLSVIAFGYYLRVIVVMYMQDAPEGEPRPVTTRPLTAGVATLACCVGVLVIGVLPGRVWDELSPQPEQGAQLERPVSGGADTTGAALELDQR